MPIKLNIYKNADYEVRTKAPIALTIQLVVMTLMLVMGVMQFFINEVITGIGILVLLLVYTGSFILLIKGKYDISVRIFTAITGAFMTLYQYLAGFTSVLVFPQFAMMHIAILVMAVYLIRQSRIFNLYIMLSIISYSAFLIIHIVNGNSLKEELDVVTQLDSTLLVYIICIVLLYHLKRTFLLITNDVNDQLQANKKRSDHLDSVMRTAVDQLNGTLGLQGHTKETKESAEEINVKISKIRTLVQSLNNSFSSTQEAIADIHNSMADLSDKAQNQASNVVESSAAIEEMVASISSVAHIIEQRKEGVQTLSDTSEAGAEIVNKTQNSFDHVLQQISSITDMAKMISGIASQTNLLAMNAAIEAAHAGEAGSGFAVVADEIRKLAENSALNASQISTNLKELIASIQQTGIEVKNTGDSFNKIRIEVKDVSTAMEEIYSSTQELTKGSGEILNATSNLNNLTASVKDGVHTVENDLGIINSNINSGIELNIELNQEADVIVDETSDILEAVEQVFSMAVQLNTKSEELNRSINSINIT